MIRLAELIKTFLPDLEQKYGSRLLPSHRQALTAIEQCRTQALGSVASHWRRKTGKSLFPHKALAKVLRTKWFHAMKVRGWAVQANLPAPWLVDCKQVGNGDLALAYLGRYR
ncbi:MAG: hypothetical protein IPN92_13065 [Chromatiaceae bacterium]|nr:hypothetical protein [Chromatiaceae bacterium]